MKMGTSLDTFGKLEVGSPANQETGYLLVLLQARVWNLAWTRLLEPGTVVAAERMNTSTNVNYPSQASFARRSHPII
jgi:hypothetical protein